MTKTLAEEIEEIMKLDGKRTPGAWEANRGCVRSDLSQTYEIKGTSINTSRTIVCEVDLPFETTGKPYDKITTDSLFIAQAPRMVEIIKTLTNAIIILPDDAEPGVGDLVRSTFFKKDAEITISKQIFEVYFEESKDWMYKIIQRQGKPVIYESQLKPKQGD